VYTPREDTFFIEDCLDDFFSKNNLLSENPIICEMGCGSGYLSIQLSKLFINSVLYLIDINHDALGLTRQNFNGNNITNRQIHYLNSDLFSIFS
jgi:methylase of polypeptide subunit release factors